MKQFLVFLLILAAAVGGWYGRELIPEHEEGEEAHADEHAKEEKKSIEIENGVVKLDEETEQRLGIAVTPLIAVERAPATRAIGHVLDPAALVTLESEIAIATAARDASRTELERQQKSGDNIAHKLVDAAAVQARADELKVTTLKRRLPLEWGALTANLDATALGQLCDKLARGETGIVRVEVLIGDAPAAFPKAAIIKGIADDARPIAATRIFPAPSVDARTQSSAFLLLCEFANDARLQPGAAVTADLSGTGEIKKGVLLPRGSIVRQGPQTWVYVEKEERAFTRLPIIADARDEAGWFVMNDALAVGSKLVTTGAAALLSAELTAAGAGGGEEE